MNSSCLLLLLALDEWMMLGKPRRELVVPRFFFLVYSPLSIHVAAAL